MELHQRKEKPYVGNNRQEKCIDKRLNFSHKEDREYEYCDENGVSELREGKASGTMRMRRQKHSLNMTKELDK